MPLRTGSAPGSRARLDGPEPSHWQTYCRSKCHVAGAGTLRASFIQKVRVRGAVTRCPQVRFYEVCHWNGNWRGQLSQWQRAGTASHMGGDTRGGSEPLSLGILPYECSLPSSLACQCVGCPRSYTRIAHPLARPLHSQEARVAAPLAYPGSTEA